MAAAAASSDAGSGLPSPARAACLLQRLNSLLTLIPLSAKRRRWRMAPLVAAAKDDDPKQQAQDSGKAVNLSAITRALVSKLGSERVSQLVAQGALPPVSELRSGDIVQTQGYRGCGRHFVLWLRAGLAPPSPAFISALASFLESERLAEHMESEGAEGDDDSRPGQAVSLSLEDMRALQAFERSTEEGDYDFNNYEDDLGRVLGDAVEPSVLASILDGSLSLAQLYWVAPTSDQPVLVSRADAGLDPLLASDGLSVSEEHDAYLFPHLDEFGYEDSPVASLAPDRYLGAETASDDGIARFVDPLLSHSRAQIGVKCRAAQQKRPAAEREAFLRSYWGQVCPAEQPGIEWFSLDSAERRVGEGVSAAMQARQIMAAHVEWLAQRVRALRPDAARALHCLQGLPASLSPEALLLKPVGEDKALEDDETLRALLADVHPLEVMEAPNDGYSDEGEDGEGDDEDEHGDGEDDGDD